MDPRIASGFSILGNALMPDPSKLAQAEVYRSQMLENQANTGKLTAETDALKNAANNLARLQDLLANPESSTNDLLATSVASGITNDPSQLPRFILGGQSLEGLDAAGGVTNNDAFSRALLGTGQVANQAATPTGFAADQARQAAQAAATNATTQRGQNMESADRRLDIQTDASTALDVAGIDRGTKLDIAAQQRVLDDLLNQRDNLVKEHGFAIESGDRNKRLEVEGQWKVLDRNITLAVAKAKDLTDQAIAEAGNVSSEIIATGQNVAAGQRNDASNATALQQTILQQAGAKERAIIQYGGSGANAGGGWKGVSPTERDTAYSEVIINLAQRLDPEVDVTDEGDVKGAFYYNPQPPEHMVLAALKTAFQIVGPQDPIGAAELVTSAIQWNEEKKTWQVQTNIFDEAETEYGIGDTGTEDAPEPDDDGKVGPKGDKLAVTPAATEADEPDGTGAAEQTMIDTRNNRQTYLENGKWYYTDDNKYVPGQ